MSDLSRDGLTRRRQVRRVRGTTGFDGLERISTQTLMDILEVPQRQRNAGAYRHLATLMVELGWTAVRVRDLTRGGYKEQVRDTSVEHQAIPTNGQGAKVPVSYAQPNSVTERGITTPTQTSTNARSRTVSRKELTGNEVHPVTCLELAVKPGAVLDGCW